MIFGGIESRMQPGRCLPNQDGDSHAKLCMMDMTAGRTRISVYPSIPIPSACVGICPEREHQPVVCKVPSCKRPNEVHFQFSIHEGNLNVVSPVQTICVSICCKHVSIQNANRTAAAPLGETNHAEYGNQGGSKSQTRNAYTLIATE